MAVLSYSYMINGSKLMFHFYYLAAVLFLVAIWVHVAYVFPKEKKAIEEKVGKLNSIDLKEEKI